MLIAAAVAVLLQPVPFYGFETDQYNLPPVPLADIGDEVTAYVADMLAKAAENVNSEIAKAQRCLETPSLAGCAAAEKTTARLEYLRSDTAIAQAVSDVLAGDNLTTTKFGKWIAGHKFAGQPDRYKAGYRESIYLLNPPNYVTLSPTVRLYGYEFGIDKLEHLFQQGHQYFEIEAKELRRQKTLAEAERKAVDWGKRTERTYYGLLTSGVYSNADLAANFVGLRFYQGLTRPLTIDGKPRPQTFVLKNGLWAINKAGVSSEDLLKPFLGEHLNEAHNPSSFRFTLAGFVRRAVRKNACSEWKSAFPSLTKDAFEARADSLKRWNGEDYGHTPRDRTITIADTCF